MARIEEHVDVALDFQVGKVTGATMTPWIDTQPDSRMLADLRDKARARLAGDGQFDADEIQDALARLILGG